MILVLGNHYMVQLGVSQLHQHSPSPQGVLWILPVFSKPSVLQLPFSILQHYFLSLYWNNKHSLGSLIFKKAKPSLDSWSTQGIIPYFFLMIHL